MSKGGARFTHANLLARDLDFIAMEAQATREEVEKNSLTYEGLRMRLAQFALECEFLARSCGRHLEGLARA